MKIVLKKGFLCLLLWCVVFVGNLAADRAMLRRDVVRLHVVGASNGSVDQEIKLQVRDAVLAHLQGAMTACTQAAEAKDWIAGHLPQIQAAANEALAAAGSGDTATATLQTEEFPRRIYDTFSLPAGVYDALRITIGAGEGRNWWCVVFPSLCVPETAAGFHDAAAGAGFSQELTDTLTTDYEVRFLLLDLLGRMENFLHQS